MSQGLEWGRRLKALSCKQTCTIQDLLSICPSGTLFSPWYVSTSQKNRHRLKTSLRCMGLSHHLTRVTNFCLSFPSRPKPQWEWQRGSVLFPISKPPSFSLKCFANAWVNLSTTCSQEQPTNLVNGFLIICMPRESTCYFLGLRSII